MRVGLNMCGVEGQRVLGFEDSLLEVALDLFNAGELPQTVARHDLAEFFTGREAGQAA